MRDPYRLERDGMFACTLCRGYLDGYSINSSLPPMNFSRTLQIDCDCSTVFSSLCLNMGLPQSDAVVFTLGSQLPSPTAVSRIMLMCTIFCEIPAEHRSIQGMRIVNAINPIYNQGTRIPSPALRNATVATRLPYVFPFPFQAHHSYVPLSMRRRPARCRLVCVCMVSLGLYQAWDGRQGGFVREEGDTYGMYRIPASSSCWRISSCSCV